MLAHVGGTDMLGYVDREVLHTCWPLWVAQICWNMWIMTYCTMYMLAHIPISEQIMRCWDREL